MVQTEMLFGRVEWGPLAGVITCKVLMQAASDLLRVGLNPRGSHGPGMSRAATASPNSFLMAR